MGGWGGGMNACINARGHKGKERRDGESELIRGNLT